MLYLENTLYEDVFDDLFPSWKITF